MLIFKLSGCENLFLFFQLSLQFPLVQNGQFVSSKYYFSGKKDIKVFHAGTRFHEDSLTSNGGRVLCVTALGCSIQSAQKKVYNAISEIAYEDAFYRKDIGYKAIDREKEK